MRNQRNQMTEEAQVRRMLEWFKAQLPPHDLEGGWDIRAQPESPATVIEGRKGLYHQPSMHGYRIVGDARCQRCGEHFAIPSWGNAMAASEEGIPRVVEKMKAWVAREAGGPCWGDVPKLPDLEHVAILDSTMSAVG